jgi:hypothetical protein
MISPSDNLAHCNDVNFPELMLSVFLIPHPASGRPVAMPKRRDPPSAFIQLGTA